MSNVYGLALIAKCREDLKKIELRAKELLNELTPEEHKDFGFNSFGPNENGDIGISFQTTLPVLEQVARNVGDGIALSFPEMKLVAYETWEGPIQQICERKRRVRESRALKRRERRVLT